METDSHKVPNDTSACSSGNKKANSDGLTRRAIQKTPDEYDCINDYASIHAGSESPDYEAEQSGTQSPTRRTLPVPHSVYETLTSSGATSDNSSCNIVSRHRCIFFAAVTLFIVMLCVMSVLMGFFISASFVNPTNDKKSGKLNI